MLTLGRPTQTKAVLLALVFALLYIGSDHLFHLFEIPKLKTLDQFFQWRLPFVKPQPSIHDITIVGLDDDTMSRMDRQWPYRRSTYAYAVKELIPFKPKVVGYDFVFAGEGILPEDDAFLAQTIKDAGNVIVASFIGPKGELVSSREMFKKEAVGEGVINMAEDEDNGVRRGRVFYWTKTNPFAEWSWEMKMLQNVKGLDPQTARLEGGGLSLTDRAGREYRLPLLSDRTFDINYKAKMKDFRTLSFWKVFTHDFPKEAITDKIVLVGLTSRLFHDEHPTPLELQIGVHMIANAILTLLDQDFMKRIPDFAVEGTALVLAVLVAFLTWRLRMSLAILLVLLLVGTSGGASFYALLHNWRGDFFSVPFLVISSFLVTSFYRQIASFIENARLRTEAITDPLTGLYTRRFLEVKLSSELARIAHEKKRRHVHHVHDLCVFMTDVDHFKSVNDTYGHDEGDRVLREVAAALHRTARKTDVVARYGGEEFTVVLMGTGKAEGLKAAEKFRKAIEDQVKITRGDQTRVITISIGLASAREDEMLEYEKILKASDLALYQSKESGRNRVTGFSPDLASAK